MPDSAVNAPSDSQLPASANEGLFGPGAGPRPERAARSAPRADHASPLPRGVTPDLFVEDIERLTAQATNIDVRQGTLAGFELPAAFLAAVCAAATPLDATADRRPVRDEPAAQSQIEMLTKSENDV